MVKKLKNGRQGREWRIIVKDRYPTLSVCCLFKRHLEKISLGQVKAQIFVKYQKKICSRTESEQKFVKGVLENCHQL